MARMLGRFSYGCACRDCAPGGGTRRQKRIEARRWMAAEGFLPAGLIPVPFTDLSDCRHGCNGSEVIAGYPSDVCDWQCHPDLRPDPERAARFDAKLAELTGA